MIRLFTAEAGMRTKHLLDLLVRIKLLSNETWGVAYFKVHDDTTWSWERPPDIYWVKGARENV